MAILACLAVLASGVQSHEIFFVFLSYLDLDVHVGIGSDKFHFILRSTVGMYVLLTHLVSTHPPFKLFSALFALHKTKKTQERPRGPRDLVLVLDIYTVFSLLLTCHTSK